VKKQKQENVVVRTETLTVVSKPVDVVVAADNAKLL
jgi:hypothetical protein